MNRYASLYLHFSRLPGPISRVASRWLLANMIAEYDALMRLQFLEGVLGAPPGSFWTKGTRGLALAQAMAARPDAPPIEPSWFSRTPTGIMLHVSRVLNTQLQGQSDPYEVINQMMMATDKRGVFYRLGANPKYTNVASDPVDKSFGLWVQTAKFYIGKFRRNLRRQELGESVFDRDDQKERGLDRVEDTSVSDLLPAILAGKDSLGVAIRQIMRDAFQGSAPMQYYVDVLEREARIPTLTDIAEASGVTPQTVKQRHYQVRMPVFARKLWSNSRVMNALQARLEQAGVELDDVNFERIFLSGDFGNFPMGRARSST